MKQHPILLLGAGGHAMSCIDVIEQEGRFSIAGLLGLHSERGGIVLGYPVLAAEPGEWRDLAAHAVVTVGQIRSPRLRKRLFDDLRQAGLEAPSIVSPYATVSRHADIGAGTMVMHSAIVNAGAVVGENCIINSRALVEHGARIGDHSHVATGAVVNGDVQVGPGSFIGSGAVIREGVVLGAGVIVGMGALVRADLADGAMVRR